MRELAKVTGTLALAACGALTILSSAEAATVVATTRADTFLKLGGAVTQQDHDPAFGSTAGTTTAQSYDDDGDDYQLGAYGQAKQTGAIEASAFAITSVAPGGATGRIQADGGAETVLQYTNATSDVHAYLDFSVDYLKVAAVNGQASAGVGEVFNAIYGYAFAYVDGVNLFANSNLFTFSVLDNGPQYVYDQTVSSNLTNVTNTISCASFQCASSDYLNTAAIAGTLDLGVLNAGSQLYVDYVINARAYADMVYRDLGVGEAYYLGIANGEAADYCGESCGLHYARLRFVDLGDGDPTAGVPEPSSWALMIAGFGIAGAALRRRGRRLA